MAPSVVARASSPRGGERVLTGDPRASLTGGKRGLSERIEGNSPEERAAPSVGARALPGRSGAFSLGSNGDFLLGQKGKFP